ncbi:hypothetical protein C1T30_43230, partial [Bacillus sp. MBGLi97]
MHQGGQVDHADQQGGQGGGAADRERQGDQDRHAADQQQRPPQAAWLAELVTEESGRQGEEELRPGDESEEARRTDMPERAVDLA